MIDTPIHNPLRIPRDGRINWPIVCFWLAAIAFWGVVAWRWVR